MPGPLDGIRVLDLTRYQQGPFATALLSDMGADVVKVEPRPDGEWGRQAERDSSGYSPYFETYNRGKRSLSLNIQSEAGREIMLRLARDVDVFTENFRPGFLDGIGLGYQHVRAVNPAIIYGSASAFGSRGPLARRPGYDHIAQAVTGLMVEQAGGLAADEPVPALAGATDQFSATLFALAITSALVARGRTGHGQHVEVSLLGSTMALQGRQIARYLRTGKQGRASARRSALYSHYRTADGWVAIGAHHPRAWPRLCAALELDALVDDERFAGPWERFKHDADLERELETTFATRSSADWLERLVQHDVPCGPVQDYAGLLGDALWREQIDANGYLLSSDGAADALAVGLPLRFSGTPAQPQSRAPELGEQSEEILSGLGMSWEQIERLRRDEII
jgi:crotonobetainyl-CoA:carnitine CoA-transferase CaiB-like acyl-CoA transferase